MKKIAFALQVFSLVTVFPLYVIIELNNAKVAQTENNIIKNLPGDETGLSANTGLQNKTGVADKHDKRTAILPAIRRKN